MIDSIERFDLVALMTVRGDHVHDFAGNAVLVGQRDAAERMPHLLSKFSLNHFARRVLVELERFADIGQERAGDEIIALNRNAAAERTLQHIRDGDALQRAGIEMLDERHVDVAGEERELDGAQFIEGPAFPPQPVVIASFQTAATFSRSDASLIFIRLGKVPRFR